MKEIKQRERNVAHMWADKRVLRLFRKNFKRSIYKNLRSIYCGMIEIDSDFTEERESKVKCIHSFTKTLCTYTGMDQGTVSPIARILKALKLVDYGIKKDDRGQIIGSFLIMYEFIDNEFHVENLIRENPYKEKTLSFKNIKVNKESKEDELPKGNSGMIFNHPSISDEEDNEDSTGRILSRRKSQDMIITEKELILIKEEETKDDYNNIKSAEIKEILRHWNNQLETRSVRLPKNGNAPTKIYTKVVKTYLPRLLQNGYGASIIKKSISIYNELLHNTYDYILRDDVIGHKVSFDEFLNGFTVNTKKRIFPNNPVKKGTVWFKECLKGQDYLDDKYGLEVKDKYPKWTQEVKDFIMKPTTNTKAGTYPYVDYRFPEINFKGSEHMQNGNFSISERNFCVRVAKRLNIFIDTYAEYDNGKKKSIKWMRGDDRMLWVLFLFRAISHTIGDGQKIPLTYLTSTKTYEQLLPNFLKYDNKLDKNFIPLDMPWKDYKDKHNRKGGK